MESAHREDDTCPHAKAVVNNHAVHEEALEATIKEMEHPLLGRVGTMVEDVAASIGALGVEVLLTVPCAPLCLGHTKALAVTKTQVLSVTLLVVG